MVEAIETLTIADLDIFQCDACNGAIWILFSSCLISYFVLLEIKTSSDTEWNWKHLKTGVEYLIREKSW